MDGVAVDLEYAARSLFRRCVQCPNTPPACPSCGTNQRCELFSGTCDSCSYTQCVATSSTASSTTSSSSGSPIGPIVGGVIGGIVLVSAIVFLVYWFWIRPRKQKFQGEEWEDEPNGIEKHDMNQLHAGGDTRRASTHTVNSMASTVMTRASNVIPIAYIPGVTNRSMHSSPELIPPVPPIPAASAGTSAMNSPEPDQHFFMPSDLRQSSYSSFSDRTSMTRGSVASSKYRSDAIVNPMPAQAVTRLKPNAVSVKSSTKTSPDMSRSTTPPIPTSTYANTSASSSSKPSRQPTLNTKSSIVGKFAQPKAITVTRKGSNSLRPHKQGLFELDGASSHRSVSPLSTQRTFTNATGSPQYSHHSSTFRDTNSSDEEDDEVHELAAGQGLISHNNRRSHNIVHEAPTSPLSIPSYSKSPELGGPSSNMHKRNSSLNKVIEEATRMAAQTQMQRYDHVEAESSPFSDANAAQTP
ncbi:hypothetical protein MMC10_008616 [Thelotrema lepadinum]|nr:hypothetical protein [Thelotrema lepadinum]